MNGCHWRRGLRLMLSVLGACLLLTTTPSTAAAGTDPTWEWPLRPQPAVLAAFEAPVGPYGPGHRGVDLAGTVGQPVLAVDAGRVSFAGQVAGRGVVVVDHGGLRTTYEPVLVAVSRDERLRAGALIGTLTLAGGHCLPAACLHLGARLRDTYVDPLRYLGTGPVRLLPLEGDPVAPSWRTTPSPAARPPLVPVWSGLGLL